MFESDADRLALIKSLGGQLVRYAGGEFWAIFDREYYEAGFGDGPAVESSQPALTARTSDVKNLLKDTPLDITVDGQVETYFVKRHQPDGTGMSVVFLKR